MSLSEFRKHPVNGEWSVIASGRRKRPHRLEETRNKPTPKRGCPFEVLGTSTHIEPLLVFDRNGAELHGAEAQNNWFVQVVPNKFPAFVPDIDIKDQHVGPYETRSGYGYHEVLIMREHTRHWSEFNRREAETIFKAYHQRYVDLSAMSSIKYVSIFHNFGPDAGASIYHPHSQFMAIPVVPRDVHRSYRGSERYFLKHGKSVHQRIMRWELQQGERIVYENDTMVAFCPFASRTTFEVRIFPKRRTPDFAGATNRELADAGDAVRRVLKALKTRLGNPSFNFFFHTAHCEDRVCQEHYHWHIEILPKVSIWAGFEVGTGIEISTVDPKDAAAMLRSGARAKARVAKRRSANSK